VVIVATGVFNGGLLVRGARPFPDDLVEAHPRAGIHDWTIWRSGRELFHLVECDDLETAFRLLDGDHVEQIDATPLQLVWRMRDQIGDH
jgi:hypothetical protein